MIHVHSNLSQLGSSRLSTDTSLSLSLSLSVSRAICLKPRPIPSPEPRQRRGCGPRFISSPSPRASPLPTKRMRPAGPPAHRGVWGRRAATEVLSRRDGGRRRGATGGGGGSSSSRGGGEGYPSLIAFASQSSPSCSPSPLMADVLKICHCRCLSDASPSLSATASTGKALGRSCLFAKTSSAASLSSSSSSIVTSSCFEIPIRSASALSTT
mmetsp:Transcript_37297/g.121299  ORF Transcript_37297/g.121299 Transcript_37297/m.121299 type:complete len:212 (+) Transcript_37297:52-687(+)